MSWPSSFFHNEVKPLKEFDGQSHCFIGSDYGKAFLIDLNDEHKTHDGPFSFGFGPMKLLEERRIHHLSKLFYRHVY